MFQVKVTGLHEIYVLYTVTHLKTFMKFRLSFT